MPSRQVEKETNFDFMAKYLSTFAGDLPTKYAVEAHVRHLCIMNSEYIQFMIWYHPCNICYPVIITYVICIIFSIS